MQAIQQPKISIFSSVRTQLVIVSIFAVIIAVLITQFVTISTTQNEIKKGANSNLAAIASSSSVAISNLLSEQAALLRVLTDNRGLELRARQQSESYGSDLEEVREQIQEIDGQWAISADNSPLVQGILNRDASTSLRQFQLNFPNQVEVFATDSYGALVAATTRTSDYDQSDEEWWLRAWNNGNGALYIDRRIQLDASTGVYGLIIAVPIEDADGVVGVLRATYSLSSIQTLVDNSQFGETGHIALVNSDGEVLAVPGFIGGDIVLDEFREILLNQDETAPDELTVITDENELQAVVQFSRISSGGTLSALDDLGWYVLALQEEDEALAPVNESLNAVIVPVVAIVLVMILISFLLARRLTSPLTKMRQAAQQLINQQWETRVDVKERNELGELAYTFNVMAGQLQAFVDEMDSRIQEQTRDLRAVIDVSNQISNLLDPNRLLQDVVDLTKERFRLYHAHIYLLDEEGEILMLAAGAGHVGRQMVSEQRRISLQNLTSVVATAGRTRESVIINDVELSETFLPHPLLPDTRSELAVPLIARGQLVGVLDVQSDQINYFTDQTLTVLETLGNQISVAISNATLYQVAERTSRHEQALSSIAQRLQGATNVDEVLQVAVRELGKALRVPHTAIQLDMTENEGSPIKG